MRISVISAAALTLMAAVAPAGAQTRPDLRGPTGQQRVKLPPGVEGATGGGEAHPRAHCRMVMHYHHRVRTCRAARG